MTVVVLLEIKAKPERFEDLKAWHRDNLADTRASQGCLEVLACANPADHSLHIYERWEKRADQERYVAWRVARGDPAKVAGMLRAPTVFEEREDLFY